MDTERVHSQDGMESIYGIGFILLTLWLIALSVIVYRTVSHYNTLTGKTSKHTLTQALEVLMKGQDDIAKRLIHLTDEHKKLVDRTGFHIQRIGILRFNPFSDTGGSQSFTIALLDRHDSGIVMTSLYARTGNRWYVKEVKNGAGVEHELSKEERQAISQAKKVSEAV